MRTLGGKGTVKIKDEEVIIDPKLLFQRLVTAGNHRDDLTEVFQYELCTYPPVLFFQQMYTEGNEQSHSSRCPLETNAKIITSTK